MQNSEITPTLLHAMLKNQSALTDALQGIANWIEDQNGSVVAFSVRESLRSIEENRKIIGTCISQLMNPN
ncbi:hypothetical protein [Pseudomonas sp. NFR16]|uniref:hypothetical protein n=1 Tax=Pseudomonas sp. NFR16 TaxID=1566248 RepID=UPI0008B22BAD|nr:hypothetical protein [Pseudomonas sp. NFR16]SEJ80803.1 hypothetical protein SAMN03159495_4663 [Pseudomonas sp. NFR16]